MQNERKLSAIHRKRRIKKEINLREEKHSRKISRDRCSTYDYIGVNIEIFRFTKRGRTLKRPRWLVVLHTSLSHSWLVVLHLE